MGYARWATEKEVAERLDKIELGGDIEKSGIPIGFDNNSLYVDTNEAHNLIIGSTGSGKTQALILPMLKLAMLAKESIVINDPKGELYSRCSGILKSNGYDVKILDFNDAKKGNSWNPLKMPYDLYISGERDKAVKCLEDVGYYLFFDNNDKSSDPFWVNSTINYFMGIVLYLFDNAKEDEINLESVYNFSNYLSKESNALKILNKIAQNGLIYINLAGTLLAPTETKGSIIAVFNQKIKGYISRENLSNMLGSNDVDIKNINSRPSALFIVSGVSNYCNNLIPLIVNQIIDYIEVKGNKHLNILLDEFDSMVPIKDFSRIIENSRSVGIRITVTIRSYIHLCNMYSKEEAEILKMCFGNLIYLLSDDIYTLDEISKYCGNQMINGNLEPLVTIEDLKTIKTFEGIVIMPRMMPIKTKFLPNYKISWKFSESNDEIPLRNITKLSIYEEKN